MRIKVLAILIASGESENYDDCWEGTNYTGTVSRTLSNTRCVWWPNDYIKKYGAKLNNRYCRNPNNNPKGPWCTYFINRTRRGRAYCGVPKCLVSVAFRGNDRIIPIEKESCWCSGTFTVFGNLSKTKYGKQCQNWSENYPHKPKYRNNGADHNYCANPDSDNKGPWCYTTDPNTRYEHCQIPKCSDYKCPEKPTTIKPATSSESCWCSNTSTVFGTLSKTIYGKECQNWSENYPHRPKYRNNGADNNYCANPDNDHKGPWCYTTDPNTRYEHCQISKCPDYKCPHKPTVTKRVRLTTTTTRRFWLPTSTTEPTTINKPSTITKEFCGISQIAYTMQENFPTCLSVNDENTGYYEMPSCMFGIIDGTATKSDKSWPWQISISTAKTTCGGTLISLRTIMSAAHCFSKYEALSEISVSIGHLSKWSHEASQERGYQKRKVGKIIRHPSYNEDTKDHDIALMITTQQFVYTDYVKPACLPKDKFDLPHGTKCVISGWGATQSAYVDNLQLQFATLKVLDNVSCNKLMYGKITDNMICAGGNGRDTCQGDSGGPLVCSTLSHYTVFGITSWGYGCGRINSPGVYTKVQSLLPWIGKNLV